MRTNWISCFAFMLLGCGAGGSLEHLVKFKADNPHAKVAPSPPILEVHFVEHAPSNIVLITAPGTRIDNSALELTEIANIRLKKAVGDGALRVIQVYGAPIHVGQITYTDNSPDSGELDTYAATVIDVEGHVSPISTTRIQVPSFK